MSSNRQNPRTFKLKKWVVVTLLASLSHAGVVNATGLGKLNVQSRLGQPFAAEIDLINVSKEDLGKLNVSLAPQASYQAINLPFDPVLNGLRLSVERRANGTPYIRASSTRRVTEPYIHLLVELTAQEGKLQREYVALLDLPAGPQPAVVAAKPRAVAPARKTEAAAARPPKAARARKKAVAQGATSDAVSAPVVAAPVPDIPPTCTPTTPAETGNNAVAHLDSKPVEPIKSELLQSTPAKSESATTEASQTEPPKPEPKEPATVPAPEPPAPVAKKAIPPPAPPQRGFFDIAMNHIGLIGGTLALLAGIGAIWAWRRRKQEAKEADEAIAAMVDAETLEEETTADTAVAVTAASIHTVPRSAPSAVATSSNELTPPKATVSNVTKIVDPIDEAKVYLEYGQYEPAEKSLRKALSNQPGREDIQMMLLEILALRGDKDGFNQIAGRLHKQTGGQGTNWKRAMAMGYKLDPSYQLYSPTDQVAAQAPDGVTAANAAIDPGKPAPPPDQMRDTIEILPFGSDASKDVGEGMVYSPTAPEPAATAPDPVKEGMVYSPAAPEPAATAPEPLPALDFEFPPASATPSADIPEKAVAAPVVDFEIPGPSATPSADIPEKAVAAPATKDEPGFDFKVDFSGIKPKQEKELLSAPAPATVAHDPPQDEMQQKLVLARAYQTMGDKEGALELLREVEREGAPGLQAEARIMLKTLG